MSKILIIEDDNNINQMLCKLLKLNGYEVVSAYSGTEGVLLHNEEVDLVLLDLMLPGKSGEEVIKDLQEKSQVPVIVTSAISDVEKKLDLFKLGADDYVTKPFNNQELLARIEIQLRHKRKEIDADKSGNILTFKDVELNVSDRSVLCNQKPVAFSKTEFELLYVLMKSPHQVFTKNALIESVWDNEDSADDNSLNVHISKIRNKLKAANETEEYIETVWSVGYRMKKI